MDSAEIGVSDDGHVAGAGKSGGSSPKSVGGVWSPRFGACSPRSGRSSPRYPSSEAASPNSSGGGGGGSCRKPQCLCAPTAHAGSFRCRMHRASSKEWDKLAAAACAATPPPSDSSSSSSTVPATSAHAPSVVAQ